MTNFVSSELSDTEIMSKTTVERQAASGRLSLTFKLWNGKDIVGTVPESNKAQGIIQWCATVNATIKAEQQEERLRQKKLAAERKSALIVPPESSSATQAPTNTLAGMPLGISAGLNSSSDPIAFVRDTLAAALHNEETCRQRRDEAESAYKAAAATTATWQAVAKSLGITQE